MPLLNRPRVLSLNFFNRGENGPSSSASNDGAVALKNTDSSTSSTADIPAKAPTSPTFRETISSAIPSRARAGTTGSRPASQMYSYTPPLIGPGPTEHIEELLPVFSYLSSHSNKLYQEGYFLKLNDLDTSGKPNSDRNWTECFAQLVGTVLSLWDAAALDAAGQDGEVPPSFINLADASIKMIETLPTRNQDVQPLQNVLSISTAGKNRYLLHFNSLHSLTQWTAGIRLSMFEHASLQELYTGSLIAGKGKHLNNIRTIMERSRFPTEDWARVRFGAGTPWRRCWCVIEPPNEKEFAKANKVSLRKKSAYDRPVQPKGDIKFYDTKKTKKAVPIATITDAYSAYAIYPQSKPLIDQSTLVKVEGKITIHSSPESKTEGFVFVMPEVHPAVSGFEMLLRWIFPVYDTFNLYGRPSKLIADTLDSRGLMFAMPRDRRYGYLDIIDVAGLIHRDGSSRWTEREWRKHLKEVTSRRVQTNALENNNNNNTFPRSHRQSTGTRTGVRYEDEGPVRSQQDNQTTGRDFMDAEHGPPTNSGGLFPMTVSHGRSVSENVTSRSPTKSRSQNDPYGSARSTGEPNRNGQLPLIPAPTSTAFNQPYHRPKDRRNDIDQLDSHNSSDSELHGSHTNPEEVAQEMGELAQPMPVVAPPTMQHEPGDRPKTRPAERADLRREKSRMSNATLAQLTEASKITSSESTAAAGAMMAWKAREGAVSDETTHRGVTETPNTVARIPTNQGPFDAGMMTGQSEDLAQPKRPDTRSRASSGHSIARKPLPGSRNTSQHSTTRFPTEEQEPPPVPIHQAVTTQHADMYANYLVPGSAVLGRQPSPELDGQVDHDEPNNPFADSAATDFPHHADIAAHKESAKSPPKLRTGVLKTTGNPEFSKPLPANPSDIPEVDFGPTRRLTPGSSRPTTPGGLSTGRKSPFGSSPTARHTPDEKQAAPKRSPQADRPNGQSRSASYNHDQRPPMMWQPGNVLGAAGQSSQALSAEEFVQQRAAAARVPSGYVPRRNQSSGNLEGERPVSSASNKRDEFLRQHSRNASPTMMQQMQPQHDYSAKLSAREQEHVAKMTGMPLVSVPALNRVPDPSVGLIGAIEAREQEKRHMKDGISGQMVQAAIAQRQHHERQQSYGVQNQAQYAAQMAFGGQGSPSPPPPQYYGGPAVPVHQQYHGMPPQQGQWPPSQGAQQGQGQYYSSQGGPPAHHQSRYSGYYAPAGGQQDSYR